MTIEFLDLRISDRSDSDTPTVAIPLGAAPALIGDIGLQTAGVSPGNEGLVRVLLSGYVKINSVLVGDIVTITVLKNGAIPVLTTTYTAVTALQQETWGYDAVDFPTAAEVLAGQIQYTATISTAVLGPTFGAANFSGVAAAGTTTS